MSEDYADEPYEPVRTAAITIAAIGCLVMACCCGGCSLMGLGQSMFQGKKLKAAEQQRQQWLAQSEARRKELEAERTATTDAKELSRIDSELAMLKFQEPPDMRPVYEVWQRPAVRYTQLVGGGLNIALSAILLVVGFGLLGMSPWARTLGNVTAGLQIAHAVVFTALLITIVAPAMGEGMEKMQEMMQEKMRAMPGRGGRPMPMPTGSMGGMGTLMSGWFSIWGVIWMVVACIWPTVLLILLNIRKSREAFARRQ